MLDQIKISLVVEAVQFRKFGCKTEAKNITSSLSRIINDEVAINFFLTATYQTQHRKVLVEVETCVLCYSDNPSIKFRNIWYT